LDPAGTTYLPIYQPLIRAVAVAHNDYLYVLGGISRQNIGAPMNPTGSVAVYENRVWYCRPNPGGSINTEGGAGSWKVTTPLPTTLYDLAACVANNRLYIFGGRNAAGNPTNSVYFADFNPDGTLGAWTPTQAMISNGLPYNIGEHAAVFTSGRFYILGGSRDNVGGSFQNAVLFCTPNPFDGQIPAAGPSSYGYWENSTTQLEYPVASHSAVATNGYIYVLGGRYDVPHSSNVYMLNIADIAYNDVQAFAWEGTFERYIDLDRDQLVDNLAWLGTDNGEIIRAKCRFAMERGPWSDWTLEQANSPILAQRVARYVHYKFYFQTAANITPNASTPFVKQVMLNYAASKAVEDDSLMVNHNKFDPQTELLMITYKTRDHAVANVIIRIYNLEGELIRRHDISIPANTPLPATGMWMWDGANENGELVANGVYIIQYNSGNTHKIRKVVLYKR